MDFSSGLTRPPTRRSWQSPFGRDSHGFTLIELIVVVAIVGIFAAIALPGFSNLIHKNNVTAGANELYDLLQYARSEAITRRTSVIVQAPGSSNTAWTGNVSVVVGGATVRQVGTTGLQPGISITTAVGLITFQPTGTAAAACFQLAYANDASVATQYINVQPSGRVSAPSTVKPGGC